MSGGYLGFNALATVPWFILVIVLVWTIYWKGRALWKSARKEELWWFAALLVVNTLGILEILYIYYFSEREKK